MTPSINTQKHLEEIIHRSKELTKQLEQQLASDDPLHTKVETFIREIAWMSSSCNLDSLVRQLIREERRTVVNQKVDTVGPGATVIGARIDRIG